MINPDLWNIASAGYGLDTLIMRIEILLIEKRRVMVIDFYVIAKKHNPKIVFFVFTY